MVSRKMRILCTFALTVFVVLAARCGAEAADLSGHWTGTWQSGSTRHQGPLQAEFVRLDEHRYEVLFSGRFLRFVPFRYSTVMTATEQDGVVSLAGAKYLGRLFGTFSFAARATDCRFDANYSSCKDHGCFKMTRCSFAATCALQ
jgi:hypothetical protein